MDKAVPVIKVKAHLVWTDANSASYSKRGFTNINRVEYKVFNIGKVDHYAEKYSITEFSLQNLYINGLIGQNDAVKVLGNGEIKGKYNFKVMQRAKKQKLLLKLPVVPLK